MNFTTLRMYPITKPMALSDPAGKIAMKMSYFQSCNYHIMQNTVKNKKNQFIFKYQAMNSPLKISAHKNGYLTRNQMDFTTYFTIWK